MKSAKPNPFAKKPAGKPPAKSGKAGKPMPPWMHKDKKSMPAMKAGGKVGC